MGPGLLTAARPPGDRGRLCSTPLGSPLKLRPRRSQAPPRRTPSSAPDTSRAPPLDASQAPPLERLSSSAPRRFPAEVCGSEGQTPVCGVRVASYTLPQLRHLEMRLNPQGPLDRAGFRRSRVLLCRRIKRHSGLARGGARPPRLGPARGAGAPSKWVEGGFHPMFPGPVSPRQGPAMLPTRRPELGGKPEGAARAVRSRPPAVCSGCRAPAP